MTWLWCLLSFLGGIIAGWAAALLFALHRLNEVRAFALELADLDLSDGDRPE